MAKIIVGMTTSLDGFVADRSGRVGRLYPDLAALRDSAYISAAIEETAASSWEGGRSRGGSRTLTSAATSSRYPSSS